RVMTPAHYLLPRSPLRRIIAAERPDLVEVCDKYTLNYLGVVLRRRWLLGRQDRPAVIGLSCERMGGNVGRDVSTSPLLKSLCRVYMKWLYFPMFDHHIVVSQHAAGELRDASRGHSVRRGVWVRSMGADCDLFRPERRNGAIRYWLRALTGAANDV